MIRNLSDHAANERTFLAGVRAAIAVMAFGFLVAKFDLFLKIAPRSPAAGKRGQHGPDAGHGLRWRRRDCAHPHWHADGGARGSALRPRWPSNRKIRARPERRESGSGAGGAGGGTRRRARDILGSRAARRHLSGCAGRNCNVRLLGKAALLQPARREDHGRQYLDDRLRSLGRTHTAATASSQGWIRLRIPLSCVRKSIRVWKKAGRSCGRSGCEIVVQGVHRSGSGLRTHRPGRKHRRSGRKQYVAGFCRRKSPITSGGPSPGVHCSTWRHRHATSVPNCRGLTLGRYPSGNFDNSPHGRSSPKAANRACRASLPIFTILGARRVTWSDYSTGLQHQGQAHLVPTSVRDRTSNLPLATTPPTSSSSGGRPRPLVSY